MKQIEIDAALARIGPEAQKNGTAEDTYVWYRFKGDESLGFLMHQSQRHGMNTLGVQDVDTGESYDVSPNVVRVEGLRSVVNRRLAASEGSM